MLSILVSAAREVVVCLNLHILLLCDKTFLRSLGRIQRHWKKQINLNFLSQTIVTDLFLKIFNDIFIFDSPNEAARLIETRYRFRRVNSS
jgi:hypothetical protein